MKQQMNISIPADLKERLDEICETGHLNRSRLVTSLIREYLDGPGLEEEVQRIHELVRDLHRELVSPQR